MSIKRKIAFNISVTFSFIFGIVMIIIYIAFNDFRREEFKNRFKQRLVYTVNVIKQFQNFEKNPALFFDENSDDVLLNEKVLIFNSNKKLIYSTVKDKNVFLNQNILEQLDKKETIYIVNQSPEIYAALRTINDKKYYILTLANDVNGISKLNYLKNILFISYVISVVMIWLTSYYLVSLFLKPLDELKKEISSFSINKISNTITIKNAKDEIGILAQSFNMMIFRLNDVFQSQKDFTSSAAHEIRTPLTRMAFQLENLIQLEQHSAKTKTTLKQLQQDVYQLSDLTKSLLLLSKVDKESITDVFEDVRIDDVVFNAFEKINRNYQDFKIDFKIEEVSNNETFFIVKGIKQLLEIVFINLLKNAAVYSDNKTAVIKVKETDFRIFIEVISDGDIIDNSERKKMFEAFTRGSNSQKIIGSGLGLRIAKRILEYHKAEIQYLVSQDNQNVFRVIFTK